MKRWSVGSLLMLSLLTTPRQTVHADAWSDHAGVPVQNTTASKSAHNDQGPRKIARIGDTVIAVADGALNQYRHDGIYRSLDNGSNWEMVGEKPYSNRGTIITGPDQTFYIFWLSTAVQEGIHMSRFRVDEDPPPSVRIYDGSVLSVATGGGYHQISASIDQQGTLYLVTHYYDSSGVDKIWFLKSGDNGDTWSSPVAIHEEPGLSFYTPHIIADHAGALLTSFSNIGEVYDGGLPDLDRRIHFLKSDNGGDTWSHTVVDDDPSTGGSLGNPVLVESMDRNLFIFAQRFYQGLVMSRSTDGGQTWSPFTLIQETRGYGDPSAAIGDDGAIYVTFRTALDELGEPYETDRTICPVTTYNCWKNAVVRSTDEGGTWERVDTNLGEDRTGPANSFRYQAWWNYGGPLEWTWMQYLASDTSLRPIFYDINTEVRIFNITDAHALRLFARRHGTDVVLQWNDIGLPSYTLYRSEDRRFMTPVVIFQGQAYEETDSGAAGAGPDYYYRVE